MTLGLSICWRGPPGSGKRDALQTQLAMWCRNIGQHYVLKKQLWDAPLHGGDVEGDDEESEKTLLPMEVSVSHWGFDVARMSLQDKQYIKIILQRWGRGSQVLASSQRCLVFYHAHLLSSESIIFLQAFLEESYKDTVIWMTSEYPLPARLSDWFVEIPVQSKGVDYSLEKMKKGASVQAIPECLVTLEDEIVAVYNQWLKTPATLSDVKRIRALVYGFLHRNIRWVDGFHNLLFALEKIPLTHAQRNELAKISIRQPFTGPGQTVPSYRIPILWENYLLFIRNVLAPAVIISETPKVTKKAAKRTVKKVANENVTI
jgi:hypothetical protein